MQENNTNSAVLPTEERNAEDTRHYRVPPPQPAPRQRTTVKASRLLFPELPTPPRIGYIPSGGGKEIQLPCTLEVYRRLETDKPNMIVHKDWVLTVEDGSVIDFYSVDKHAGIVGFQVVPDETVKSAKAETVAIRRYPSTGEVRIERAPAGVSSQLTSEMLSLLQGDPNIRPGRYLGDRYKVVNVQQTEEYDILDIDPQRR